MSAYTLISGASSGVGQALVARLSGERPLILHGRNVVKLEKVLASCSKAFPHKIWVQDLAQPEGIPASIEKLLSEECVGVNAFVHCAGIPHVLPARGLPLSTTMECFNVNCISAQQIVATLLKKRVNPEPLRSIVFISTIFSRVGARGHSIYCASKAALDGLMRALAIELAPATRVNSVLPGAMDTAMAESALGDADIVRNLQTNYPLGMGKPDDIAAAVKFLLSDDARWITGQELTVDGGRSVNFSLK